MKTINSYYFDLRWQTEPQTSPKISQHTLLIWKSKPTFHQFHWEWWKKLSKYRAGNIPSGREYVSWICKLSQWNVPGVLEAAGQMSRTLPWQRLLVRDWGHVSWEQWHLKALNKTLHKRTELSLPCGYKHICSITQSHKSPKNQDSPFTTAATETGRS